jgi:hypothetical protein
MAFGVPSSTPLSFVSAGISVLAKNVTALVRQAAKTTNLVAQGDDLKRVSTHSLRASGAMALKLQGVDDTTIMKIGRWSGLLFLTYCSLRISTPKSARSTSVWQHGWLLVSIFSMWQLL